MDGTSILIPFFFITVVNIFIFSSETSKSNFSKQLHSVISMGIHHFFQLCLIFSFTCGWAVCFRIHLLYKISKDSFIIE